MTAGQVAPAAVAIPFGGPSTWTGSLDTQELARHVSACQEGGLSAKEKGNRLEQLLCWLLGHIPGFRVEERNLYSADRSQEIDILVWNEKHPDGFPSFDDKIMAECKNWERPVDSNDVAWFAWKMRLGAVRDGILLAANGVTTNSKRRQAAVGILTQANRDEPPQHIYVLTLTEVAHLTTTTDLRDLIIRKSIRLAGADPLY